MVRSREVSRRDTDFEAIAAARAQGIVEVIVAKLGTAAQKSHFQKKGYPQRTAEIIHNKQEKHHVAAI
jgi:hypothetical protein